MSPKPNNAMPIEDAKQRSTNGTRKKSKSSACNGTTTVRNDYYVYGHYKADTGEIFYIGKGRLDRAYRCSDRTDWWKKTAKKHGYKVQILHENLVEHIASEYETKLILFYGRRDLKTGILVNMTSGGEGCCGRTMSEQTKQKISFSHMGKLGHTQSKETRAKIGLASRNQVWTEDRKAKIRSSNIGKKVTIETRNKLRSWIRTPEIRTRMSVNRAKKEWGALISPSGIVYPPFKNLRKFCRDHELVHQNLQCVYSGKSKHHRGWRLAKQKEQ